MFIARREQPDRRPDEAPTAGRQPEQDTRPRDSEGTITMIRARLASATAVAALALGVTALLASTAVAAAPSTAVAAPSGAAAAAPTPDTENVFPHTGTWGG
jgi:hypothetical protein